MKHRTPTRALFYCWQVQGGNALVLFDRDGPMSITNDAEVVVSNILFTHPNKRIFYRDTAGDWAELVHDGVKFLRFRASSNVEIRAIGRL